jgi:hypothetical protein
VPAQFSKPAGKDTLETNVAGRVKDIYLTFLQDFFAGLPDDDQFHYTGSDTPESSLEIIDISTANKEVIEKRPAIILQRSPMGWSKIGLDQLKDHDIANDIRRHTDLITGTMTLHCISKFGLAAERLASQVFYALKFHRRELQRRGIFDGGQEAQLGAETAPAAIVGGDVDPHTVDVPVYSPYSVQITWESRPAKPIKFKSMEIKLSPVSTLGSSKLGGKKVVELDSIAQTVSLE